MTRYYLRRAGLSSRVGRRWWAGYGLPLAEDGRDADTLHTRDEARACRERVASLHPGAWRIVRVGRRT